MERYFPRDISALASITAFAEGFLEGNGLAAAYSFPVNFVIEELFTNMVKYSGGGKEIGVRLEMAGNAIIMRVTEFDVEPFDPTAAPDADTTLPLEQRTPGGLGLHLIRRMVDSIEYEYVNRESRITVTKRLENAHV